jgi:hypothetical protein
MEINMTNYFWHVDQRVRLTTDVAPYPLGLLPKGACGLVVEVRDNATVGNPIAHVLMDDRFDFLDEWDNMLQVFRYADEASEVTEQNFEVIEPHGFV